MNNALCRPATALPIGESFDDVVVPHLEAAHRLARWLMRNEHDAEDVVQEASLRAFRYFRTFTGGNGRAWFLRIVRNTCCSWHGHGVQATTDQFDEEQHSSARPASNPETLLLQTDDVALIDRAMSNLPDRFRELLRLREVEGLSYRELADAMGIPIGTVMSRLSRARQAFRGALANEIVLPHSRRRPQHPGWASPRRGTGHREYSTVPDDYVDVRTRLRFPQRNRQGLTITKSGRDDEQRWGWERQLLRALEEDL